MMRISKQKRPKKNGFEYYDSAFSSAIEASWPLQMTVRKLSISLQKTTVKPMDGWKLQGNLILYSSV